MAQWINDGLHESAGVIHSFLLAGQSNMAGRGDLTPDTALTAPGCLMLRMGRWQPMSELCSKGRVPAAARVWRPVLRPAMRRRASARQG